MGTEYIDVCLYEGNLYTRTVYSNSTRVDSCHVLATFMHEDDVNVFFSTLLANGVIDVNNCII